AAALTGCYRNKTFVSELESWAGSATEKLAEAAAEDQPMFLDVLGPVAVDVESFNGDVTIIADPKLERARLTFTRRATHGFQRQLEAEASLPDIGYSAEIVPGELGQVLQVRTFTTSPEPHYQRVDMLIELPEIDGVRVRTHNGGVVVTDIEGTVDIVTDDGPIRVASNHPMVRPVTIINNCGNIDFRVRTESMGEVDCQALRGQVRHHAVYGRWIVHNGTDHDTLLATFNDGTNPIVLRAADGDIRFSVVNDPTDMSPFNLFR
ncbi:MAG: DUF4097 family beta strand repeat-containing protein, partial [Planctomycetota bacterium]|nr:DUF4097 family beta strand repeat-containing protein [Planctomycetota bacterium]